MHRNVRSGFRLHARIAKSEVSTFQIEFAIKSAMKLGGEPPMTVDLRFCSALNDVSYDLFFCD